MPTKNPEVKRAGNKRYYENHKEEINEKARQYKIDNADKIKEQKAKYRIENADKIKAYSKKYNEKKRLEKLNQNLI